MCERLAKLLRVYQDSVATLSRSLDALETGRATISRAEYERLATYVDQARAKMDQACNELEKHAAEHGCFPAVHAASV
jgi:hypothetical protein